MRIFICPKTLSSNDEDSHERDFLKYYLSVKGVKATIANEVWDTFRFKLMGDSSDKLGASRTIADYRGIVKPETPRIKEDNTEADPKKEYSLEEMREATKSLLRRNWADIDIFITQELDQYATLCQDVGIKHMTLAGFYLDCMAKDDKDRDIIVDHAIKRMDDKRG